jgi:hypothetical protein
VTHITLSKKTATKPTLEFYSDGNGDVRRVTIEHFPFRIGRAETADLCVQAVEVSRDHAEIVERNGLWLVRDLGSTNGTQVNGKSIKETLLADGDILRVAETELTFVASAASQFQRMVTQPVQMKKPAGTTNALPHEIAAARRMTEATLWQTIPIRLLAARSLRHGDTDAFFASLSSGALQPFFERPHPAYERYRELERMSAIELTRELTDANRLFLAIGAAEIESPHRLFLSVKQLTEFLPGGWELGITISLPIDVDILRIGDVYRSARDLGLLVAFDEFQGNGGQVMHFQSLLPDYLLLAPNMTRDLTSNRQPLRRLESLWSACNELGIKPILRHDETGHVVALCREIGFDLMLQPASGQESRRPAELSTTV